MSPFALALIVLVLLLVFRLLNMFSQPRKPELFCRDEKFGSLLREFAPEIEEP